MKKAIPQEQDWNSFWSLSQTKQFTKVSWSKRRIIQKLQPWIRKEAGVLDAGCGSGFFSKYFCDQGMSTVALDFSDQALEIAKQLTNGRVKVIKEDLRGEKLFERVSERFDLIFSDGLLEHFPLDDQQKILRNFMSLLAPEGVIATFVPNRWSPWELIRPFFMPGIEETPFVLRDLIQLTSLGGLQLLDCGGINVLPWKLSPDKFFGNACGMLLYTIVKRNV